METLRSQVATPVAAPDPVMFANLLDAHTADIVERLNDDAVDGAVAILVHLPLERCIDAFDAGWVDPMSFITSTISLEALPRCFEALRAGAPETKVMVNPWLAETAA